jgi:branched-subunit amino acid transport protein
VKKVSGDRCAGGVMRIALAMLCIGAVTFLLRVLAALVIEAKGVPPSTIIHFAKFKPSMHRGALIEMNPVAQNRKGPTRIGERMAL